MKSKVLGTMLIAAFVASGASSLTSCKDTESDDIQEVDNNVAKLNASLQKQIKDLQDKFETISSCGCDLATNQTAKADLEKLKSEYGTDATWTSVIDSLYAKNKADLATWAAKEQSDSTKLQNQINILNKFCNDVLTSLVTNTIVQSTYSPAAGSFNFQEAGISSNTLVTYYGNNANGAYAFPTNNAAYFYNEDEASSLSDADIDGAYAKIPAGQLLDNNAGTLYVTVNPSSITYKGLNFSLETTNGEVSPFTLTDEGAVDYKLTTGYTRANASNVHALKATLSADNLEQAKLTIADKAQLKAALKKLITERDQTKASLKELAKEAVKAVYDNLNSYPLYGLATNFGLANLTDGTTTSAKNFGQANILTGAFQPLSFNTFDNVSNVNHIPGIAYAERNLANFVNSIKLQSVKIYGTDLSAVTRVNSLGKITKNADGTYKLTANVTGKKSDGTAATVDGYMTLTASELTDLLNTVSTQPVSDLDQAIEAYNNNYGDVNNLLADLNQALGYSVAVDKAKTEALDKIDSYFDNLNSRLAYWFNRTKNASLHPCMLFIGTNGEGVTGAHRLTAAGATVTGSSIKLVPTSYTYNLLAPAYKKFVKVYNGSDVLYANVISGDDYEVNVDGLKSGETYTVVYEAVDYTGKVMARKYTLNVK